MQPGKMNLNVLCIRYLTYKNLYLYVLRGVRRVSCPLLRFAFVAWDLPVLLRRWAADRGAFFLAKISYLGLNLKQTQSERRIYDSKDEEGGNPFHIWDWRQKKDSKSYRHKTTFWPERCLLSCSALALQWKTWIRDIRESLEGARYLMNTLYKPKQG